MANKYNNGRRLEWAFMEWARKKFYVPVRAAGSHGKVDIVLIPTRNSIPLRDDMMVTVYAAQLKGYSDYAPGENSKEYIEFQKSNLVCCSKIWVCKKKNSREDAWEITVV